MQTQTVARALGWFSVGLGAVEILGGKQLGAVLGMESKTGLLRAYGVREVGVGVGILTAPKTPPPGWLWARFAGDMVDIATLLAALENKDKRANVAVALAAVGGVTVLDFICAQQLSHMAQTKANASTPTDRPNLSAVGESYITVNRSADELMARWNEPEMFANVMGGFADVKPSGDGAIQWMVHTPLHTDLTWTTRMTEGENDGNQSVRWESLPGGDVPNRGTVTFKGGAPGGRGTEVALKFEFDPPGGAIGDAAAKILGFAPGILASGVLRRFKALIETGEIPTLEQNVSARGVGDTV